MTPGLMTIALALILSIAAMILLSRYLNLHAFFGLVVASLLFGFVVGKDFAEIISLMQAGFGSLLAQIGLLVALGACLGIVMEKTGAMEVISRKLVYLFGPTRTTLTMTVIGVIVGIPVFCDSGFIILSRLIPTIATQASVNPAQLSLALATGLYTTHTLVPPTPGPLATAENLGIAGNLGVTILMGITCTIPVAAVSYLLSRKLGRKITQAPAQVAAVRHHAISGLRAFTPLTLPILLIALSSFPDVLGPTGGHILRIAGQPVVALLIGLISSLTLIQKKDQTAWPAWITDALKDAGVILLITGAGGAFGAVIRSSGLDKLLSGMAGSTSGGIIFLVAGFFIAAVLKTAQGSTTSAMIIASSLLAPLALSAGFNDPLHLSLLVVAIGGGGMTVSHANDSYFWVVSQFGNIPAGDAYRSYTLITLAQGITALVTAILLFILL